MGSRPREFLAVRRVAEALAEFRPSRRTRAEVLPLADARGRVPRDDQIAPSDLPGFARATVDGYAVRASDTFGASDGLPAYLAVAGAVAMGTGPSDALAPGSAIAIPTGAALPDGADAVVMIEHTSAVTNDMVEVSRPAAPGDGMVRADEDVARGAVLVPAGRPLRPQDLGVLAAAGLVEVAVFACPIVAIIATGDEVVPPTTADLAPGQVRDALSLSLAALVAQAGGVARPLGIVRDDAAALDAAVARALGEADMVVVSAGSSVGARDVTADVFGTLPPPGVWCHGLAIKPGKPTLLAQAGDVPVVGLPGNPLSALTVFRLVGMPLVRRLGGDVTEPPRPIERAVLTRNVPSVAGRLDIVQVSVSDRVAEPRFGKSALLSVLSGADGFIMIDEDATGIAAGTEVDVERYW